MPGKFRKAPTKRTASTKSPTSKKRSIPSMRTGRKPSVSVRIPSKVTRRATNVRRASKRVVRRQAVRAQAQKIQPRPRPVVRPAARPTRRMAKKPAPPPASLRRTALRSTRRAAPSGPPKHLRRSGQMAAGAAATAGALMALNTVAAPEAISSGVNALQNTLNELQRRGDFSEIIAELNNLDTDLNHALNLLESSRERGYVYQSDLEDIAYSAADRWQTVRVQVEDAIPDQQAAFQSSLDSLNPNIRRLNASLRGANASNILKTTQEQANQLLWDLERAETALENNYDDIESDVRELTSRLTTIHWALDQIQEARFSLETGEDLVMAVPTRWDKEGKDDPEGVLYLTSQRLIFERKEKVATKKVLFITTSSELVQEVLFSQPLKNIKGVKAQNKGLFGHHDYVQITFSDKKLGTLDLHINGQDSKDWINLIQRAQSGQIEEERTTGSGIALSDLTGPLTTGDLMAVQNEVNELQDEMMLKDTHDDLSEVENKVSSLKRELADLRARGYAVEKSLEADIDVLAAQWEQVKSRAESTISGQVQLLSRQMEAIQNDLAKLMGMSANLAAARPHYVRLKSAIASAEAQADAAEDTVLDLYDEYADEVDALATHLEWVDWLLEALATASFRLLNTESGVAAVEAAWLRPGLEPENGILFLTDQRLLWEDRDGEYQLEIAVPIQQVSDVTEISDENADFDVIAISFEGGDAPVPKAEFQLALPVADDWLEMIGRARAGDYAKDRAVEIDEAELERVRKAPKQCSNCGAAFTAPILRGQTDITCEYCGVVTRI